MSSKKENALMDFDHAPVGTPLVETDPGKDEVESKPQFPDSWNQPQYATEKN